MKIANPLARRGEDKAALFLLKKGFKIIERNFRKGYGEIDIVATKDNMLVFIEVKTRTSEQYGTPFESITSWKLRSLIKTAQFYKLIHKNFPDSMRIDAISVVFDSDGKESLEHLENITGF